MTDVVGGAGFREGEVNEAVVGLVLGSGIGSCCVPPVLWMKNLLALELVRKWDPVPTLVLVRRGVALTVGETVVGLKLGSGVCSCVTQK